MKKISFLPENFLEIKDYIEKGYPVIFPTESSYGFSGDIHIPKVIKRVEYIKNRHNKAFLCLTHEFSEIKKYVKESSFQSIPEKLLKKAKTKPVTFLLEKSETFPKNFFPSFQKIGIRKTLYNPLRGFLSFYQKPIFSTSANISGHSPIFKENQIIEQFHKYRDILFVSVGDLPENPPSQIIDVENSTYKIIRK